MQPTPTTDGTWMPLASSPAAAPDMGVSSQPLFAICKRGKGGEISRSSINRRINNGLYRQVNVDYSVCHALKFNTDGLCESLAIYDVMCQYLVNFDRRLHEVPRFLSIDPGMKVMGAIGKFHLADHVDSCFAKWSLNFMKGAGNIDGEIMETLWSGMNKVSGAARSMSKAHRQETLDDYMRDANWKKTVGIGKFFISKMFGDLYIYLFTYISIDSAC